MFQYRDSDAAELPSRIAATGAIALVNRVNPDDSYDDFTTARFWTVLDAVAAAGVPALGSPRAQRAMGSKDALARVRVEAGSHRSIVLDDTPKTYEKKESGPYKLKFILCLCY